MPAVTEKIAITKQRPKNSGYVFIRSHQNEFTGGNKNIREDGNGAIKPPENKIWILKSLIVYVDIGTGGVAHDVAFKLEDVATPTALYGTWRFRYDGPTSGVTHWQIIPSGAKIEASAGYVFSMPVGELILDSNTQINIFKTGGNATDSLNYTACFEEVLI